MATDQRALTVIACTKDVCNGIYDNYGRFGAHVDAMFVACVWVQAQHLDHASACQRR